MVFLYRHQRLDKLPELYLGHRPGRIEVRNNSITEGSGHPIGLWPEGYLSQVLYGDGAAPYSPNGPAPATLGTNFRGKQLHKLPSILLFDHGQFGYDHLELERQRGDRTNAGCAGCQNMEHGYAGFGGDGRRPRLAVLEQYPRNFEPVLH